MRWLCALGFVVVVAGCSGDASGPTSSTSSSTTTIVDDTCDRVATDTVGFVEQLLDQLDDTRLIEFRQQADWPEDLVRLERRGADLDIRSAALGCDAATIRRAVLEQADLATSGPLAAGLVEFLLDPPTTTTTTPPLKRASTSEPAPQTTDTTAG